MVVEDKFKTLYNLLKKFQEKKYVDAYNELAKVDNSIGTLQDFIYSEENKYTNDNESSLNDIYIKKDKIQKENLIIDLYLINYEHIDPITLDDNYKPSQLNKREHFEYGTVISLNTVNGLYSINGMFSDIEDDKENAIAKYDKLKNTLINFSEEELLLEIEKRVNFELNL